MERITRELYQYRALLWNLVWRELKARYRGSFLGFLWTFLAPTLLMLVYSLLFSVYMRQNLEHYTLFLFVGLLPWTWFSSAVGSGASAISDRRDLITKVRFPAQVLPATVVVTNAVNYLLSLPLMFGLGFLSGVGFGAPLVAFPLVFAVQLVLTMALAFLVSAINVTFRDLQHILANVLTLMFFLTPVIYPLTTIPEAYRRLSLYVNPVSAVIVAYQDIFYYGRFPESGPLASALGVGLVLLLIGARYFESRREDFAELA